MKELCCSAGTLSALGGANWLSGVTGQSVPDMAASLGETLHGPAEVTFLPYLSGERTPHNDASMRGAFFGLAHQTGSATLMQAVMEGVARVAEAKAAAAKRAA